MDRIYVYLWYEEGYILLGTAEASVLPDGTAEIPSPHGRVTCYSMSGPGGDYYIDQSSMDWLEDAPSFIPNE